MNMRHFAMPRHHLASGLLIGALAGVAGIGFHFLVDRFGALLFGWIETNQAPISLPLVILVPTIGLCLVGLILQKVPASTLGGVREVSQALDNYGTVIPLSPRSRSQVELHDFGAGGEVSYSLRLHSAMMLSCCASVCGMATAAIVMKVGGRGAEGAGHAPGAITRYAIASSQRRAARAVLVGDIQRR
jgi:hypothetical protein